MKVSPNASDKVSEKSERESLGVGEFAKTLLVLFSTNTMDYLSIVFCYSMFHYSGESELTAVAGLVYSMSILFFGFSMDYFEPVNTLCRPYLVKENFALFKLNLWRIFLYEMLFYVGGILFCLIFSFCAGFFEISETFSRALSHILVFGLSAHFCYMINNFMRG